MHTTIFILFLLVYKRCEIKKSTIKPYLLAHSIFEVVWEDTVGRFADHCGEK